MDGEQTQPESKPKVEGGAFSIKVRDQSGNEIHFKVKPHTSFSKIFDAYKKSQSVSDVRFMFDGSRVNPEQTPQELGMEDEDSIDAFIEQTGGRWLIEAI